jgi:hypothetical protein
MQIRQYTVFPRSSRTRCTILLTPMQLLNVQRRSARQLRMHRHTDTAPRAAPM